jgi:hypothetical protein
LESRTSAHLVRVQGTQNPAEVVQNVELIAVIANQQVADAVRKAAEALARGADAETALEHLSKAKFALDACAAPELASEAAALLDEHEQKIRSQEIDSRARKNMLYEARYYAPDQQRQAVHRFPPEIGVYQKTDRRRTTERETIDRKT